MKGAEEEEDENDGRRKIVSGGDDADKRADCVGHSSGTGARKVFNFEKKSGAIHRMTSNKFYVMLPRIDLDWGKKLKRGEWRLGEREREGGEEEKEGPGPLNERVDICQTQNFKITPIFFLQ